MGTVWRASTFPVPRAVALQCVSSGRLSPLPNGRTAHEREVGSPGSVRCETGKVLGATHPDRGARARSLSDQRPAQDSRQQHQDADEARRTRAHSVRRGTGRQTAARGRRTLPAQPPRTPVTTPRETEEHRARNVSSAPRRREINQVDNDWVQAVPKRGPPGCRPSLRHADIRSEKVTDQARKLGAGTWSPSVYLVSHLGIRNGGPRVASLCPTVSHIPGKEWAPRWLQTATTRRQPFDRTYSGARNRQIGSFVNWMVCVCVCVASLLLRGHTINRLHLILQRGQPPLGRKRGGGTTQPFFLS